MFWWCAGSKEFEKLKRATTESGNKGGGPQPVIRSGSAQRCCLEEREGQAVAREDAGAPHQEKKTGGKTDSRASGQHFLNTDQSR